MPGTFTVTCDRALADAPEWVHLLPARRVRTRDTRTFIFDDPRAVIEDFKVRAVDLPVDFEHQNDTPAAKRSGPVPAAGWIKELAMRDSGLWGRVEWTDRARQMIAAKEYRYLSPSLIIEKDSRRVIRIKGAGLVHNPALHITALARQQDGVARHPRTFVRRHPDLRGVAVA